MRPSVVPGGVSLVAGFILCVVVHAAALRASVAEEPPEPTWEGRSAWEWVEQLTSTSTVKQGAAQKALRSMGAAAYPALVRAMVHPDARRRLAAALAAMECPGEAAALVPVLRQALSKPEAEVRKAAVFGLVQAGEASAPALPELLVMRSDPDVLMRRLATAPMMAMGRAVRDALPALAKALEDPDSGVRRGAVLAMSRAEEATEAFLPAILARLDDEDVEVRNNVLAVLLSSRPEAPGAMDAVRRVLESQPPRLRASAVNVLILWSSRSDEACALLVKAAADPDASVRKGAVPALGIAARRCPDVVAPALLKGLSDPDDEISEGAVGSILSLGAAARPLVPALFETWARRPGSRQIPWVVMYLLPTAGEEIVKAYGTCSREVRSALRAILLSPRQADDLARLAPALRPGLVPALAAGTGDPGDVDLLARLAERDSESVGVLVSLFAREDDAVTARAIDALHRLPGARPVVVEGLDASDARMRRHALDVLDEEPLRAGEGPRVAALLSDEDPRTRRLAAWALVGRKGQPGRRTDPTVAAHPARVAAVFAEILSDAEAADRLEAVAILGRLGAEAAPALPSLMRLLSDPSLDVVAATAAILERIARPSGTSTLALVRPMLQSASPSGRAAAALALAHAGGYGVVLRPLLEDLLASSDAPVLDLCLRAVVEMREEARPLAGQVSGIAETGDEDLSRRARLALAAIEGR